MPFTDNLAAGSYQPGRNRSGVFGDPGQTSDNDVLSIVNRLKDREMQDFKDKANFMSDLSLTQEQRMRNIFDPEKHKNIQDMNTVMGPTIPSPFGSIAGPEAGLSPEQKINLEFQKRDEARKDTELAQKGKFGQEALDIKSKQEELNRTKSEQINELKHQDLQRKVDEANNKLELAQQALNQKSDNAQAVLEARKAYQDAMEERHKAEMAMRQHQFDVTSEQHAQQIRDLEEKLKQGQNTETTTEVNPEGTTKKVTTKRGDAATTVNVIGKDGKTYTIPKDKLNDMDSDGTPHWKLAGGGEEQ